MMYKIIVADDEDIIRHGIVKLLEKDPEIEVVAQAQDGKVALALIRERLPDILLVDINMPNLGGLDLLEELRKANLSCVVIAITGYDNFAYAQKALRLGVTDYLLKPVSESMFFESLNHAKQQVEQNRKQSQYLGWARAQIERNRPALIHNFTRDWLEGRLSDAEAQQQSAALDVMLPRGNAGLLLVGITTDLGKDQTVSVWNEVTIFQAAEKLVKESFLNFRPVLTCKNENGNLVMVSAATPRTKWVQAVEQFKRRVENQMPAHLQIIMELGQDTYELPGIYQSASERMRTLDRAPAILREVRSYIESRYMDPDFSLQETADHLHVSSQHLSRVFRQHNNITFMDFLTRMRIRKAVELLADQEMKIYEIAESCGYSNQHYFSSAFKKVLGVSPMEYRKNVLLSNYAQAPRKPMEPMRIDELKNRAHC